MLQRTRIPWFLALLSIAFLSAPERHTLKRPRAAARIFFSVATVSIFFMPPILADIAKKADIKDHTQLGLSAIGGSRVYQHWNVPEEKNKAKEALKSGKVDVFTMAPIFLPDDGIEKFVKLGLDNNPKMRFFVQENWLPWDHYDTAFKAPPRKKSITTCPTVESLQKLHAPYFKAFDEHVAELNKKYETKAVHVAPIGQAVMKLREKIIAGEAPGLKVQNELFSDPIGHAKPPLQALVAYCYYSLIYEKSPVGLPAPAIIAKANESEKLNRLLQEIAWEAVTAHPLSGVKAGK